MVRLIRTELRRTPCVESLGRRPSARAFKSRHATLFFSLLAAFSCPALHPSVVPQALLLLLPLHNSAARSCLNVTASNRSVTSQLSRSLDPLCSATAAFHGLRPPRPHRAQGEGLVSCAYLRPRASRQSALGFCLRKHVDCRLKVRMLVSKIGELGVLRRAPPPRLGDRARCGLPLRVSEDLLCKAMEHITWPFSQRACPALPCPCLFL